MSEVEKLDDTELLARFITDKDWIRADRTIRPSAFIPPKNLQLSVTRHVGISEGTLTELGKAVAAIVALKRTAAYWGRADFRVATPSELGLECVAAPRPENGNHAHIVRWPSSKDERSIIALEISKRVTSVLL